MGRATGTATPAPAFNSFPVAAFHNRQKSDTGRVSDFQFFPSCSWRILALDVLRLKVFQFFPSCSERMIDVGFAESIEVFQFFPSCSVAVEVPTWVGTKVVAFNSFPVAAGSAKPSSGEWSGSPAFQFFPSCSRGREGVRQVC